MHPGAPRDDGSGKKVLDDAAVAESMALAIEQEMEFVFQQINNKSIPPIMVGGKDVGKEGRRLLFVAIARGVMKYLKEHESKLVSNVTTDMGGGVTQTVSNLTLNIDMNK